MDLILWRHAEAEEGARDLERRLTPKGKKQAARVAQWLLQRLPAKYAVVSSPASRARETAEALGVPVKSRRELLPGGSAAELLDAAGWPDHKGTVVAVGHQPTLGRAAALLLAGREQDWSLKKGALWWLEHRERDGEAQCVLRTAIGPDLV